MDPSSPVAQQWQEAQQRAETYLRALRGNVGAAERHLLAAALTSARGQLWLNPEAHPVTLVMEALFGFLPDAPNVEPPMTPPLQRATMLPEPIEFPLHHWFSGLLRSAGAN